MKIVFFVNIIRQARCIRRIEDFIKNGYDVEVYGFDREGDNRKLPQFKYNIIGKISGSSSYYKRLMMMKNKLKSVMSNQTEDIYYIFNLDVALAFMLNGGLKRKYLYEVSDLMELEVENIWISKLLVKLNRTIIKNSLETIVTSNGFVDYLFPCKTQQNIIVIPNKLNNKVLDLPKASPKEFSVDNITIGFTGAIRNEAVYNFIEVIGTTFPNMNLRLHGIFTDDRVYSVKIQDAIAKYENVEYLGPFKNPDDFPRIYSEIDLVLSLYTSKGNDKVLEPNKLYEAIYYEKPIIVSKDTFVGNYVEKKKIGYAINGEDKNEIYSFLSSITKEECEKMRYNCSLVPKVLLVDDTTLLFEKLRMLI